MKKLLLCTTVALTGLALSAPAHADGIKLDLAGHFMGYVTWMNQDTLPGVSERHFDILRETEIHFTGETTLDNGLTVGVHHEADIDAGNQTFTTPDLFVTKESYAYFSSAWGRVNFGKADGANYLLEVAAPSADENFDGLRQHINPMNYALTDLAILHNYDGLHPGVPLTSVAAQGRGFANTGKLDYANDATGFNNKVTYLTPVFSGFQAGVSYTPAVGGFLQPGGTPSVTDGSSAFGVHANDIAGAYGSAWEGSGRYEGQWQNVGITLAGGYTRVNLESSFDPLTNYDQWNLGGDLLWESFNLGVVYTQNNGGVDYNGKDRTWVVGGDYTTGPFKLGVSWLNNKEGLGEVIHGPGLGDYAGELKTNRYAGGVVYTYGPGMTFRGSVGYVKSDATAADTSIKGTDVLLGTQINF
jgi:outer membrane protein OmpU